MYSFKKEDQKILLNLTFNLNDEQKQAKAVNIRIPGYSHKRNGWFR